VRPSKIRTGVIFIGIGIAWLLYNLDRLDGWYFADLLRLWPVLLVAIGLEIIARHSKNPGLGYLSPVLIAGAFVFAAYGDGRWGGNWIRFSFDDDDPRVRTIEQTFETDGTVEEARYYIDLYNGELTVGGGGEGLGHGSFTSYDRIRTSISENDGQAVVRVRQSGPARHENSDFEVFLSPDIPLTLDLKAREADVRVNGEYLKVQKIYLEIDAGDVRVTLGRGYESVWASLSTGDARVNLRLPSGAGVRLLGLLPEEDVEWGDLRVIRGDSAVQTEGYDDAPVKFTFQVEEPVRQLSFVTY